MGGVREGGGHVGGGGPLMGDEYLLGDAVSGVVDFVRHETNRFGRSQSKGAKNQAGGWVENLVLSHLIITHNLRQNVISTKTLHFFTYFFFLPKF